MSAIVFVYVCVCVFMCVYVYVCLRVYIYVCVYVCAHSWEEDEHHVALSKQTPMYLASWLIKNQFGKSSMYVCMRWEHAHKSFISLIIEVNWFFHFFYG